VTMREINTSTVLVAVIDQFRRTRIKHTLEHTEGIELIGDSVNLSALLQQCVYREPDIVVLDLGVIDEDIIDIAEQIRTRSKNTKIMLLDHVCKTTEIMNWGRKGIIGYATSDIDGYTLSLAIQTMRTGAIWIGPQLTNRTEKTEVPPAKVTPQAIEASCMNVLSDREREVLALLVAGHKNFAIAQALAISPETIKSHMRRIMEKLSVRDRTQLVIKVLQQQGAA
jgi:DNA-binding NarL/FixJ family response regulator